MKFLVFLILIFSLRIEAQVSPQVKTLFEELKLRSLHFFIEHQHPVTGLFRDRARNSEVTPPEGNYQMASLASTGFGLAVLAHASQVGYLDPKVAQEKILLSLRFAQNSLFHHRGWFYHFVHWETGDRFGKNEVSTIDTALFMAGALLAGRVFPRTEIEKISRELYERMDFLDMMTDGGKSPLQRTLSMGWLPENDTYLPWRWDSYAEHMLLLFLGMNHPFHPLPPETWHAFDRDKSTHEFGEVFGGDLPLFIHQYSHVFLDLREFKDFYGDYFLNSKRATEVNENISLNDSQSATYREGFWGLSASGSAQGYFAFSPVFHNGTVCLGCSAASALFLPQKIGKQLLQWESLRQFPQVFGRYGYADSVNLDIDWFDPDVLGITVGTLYLALANLDKDHTPWSYFISLPGLHQTMKQVEKSVPPSWMTSKSRKCPVSPPCWSYAPGLSSLSRTGQDLWPFPRPYAPALLPRP